MIDLLVAGGGPAGLSTAILGARAGLDVVVIERRRGPVDKACGEGLMPHTVALLRGLGVEAPGKPFHGITYIDEAHCVTGRFRGAAGRGVRRTALHASLLESARAAGVRLEHGEIGPVSHDSPRAAWHGPLRAAPRSPARCGPATGRAWWTWG